MPGTTVPLSIPAFDHAFLSSLGVSSWEATGYSVLGMCGGMSLQKSRHKPFRSSFFILLLVQQGSLTMRINLTEQTVTTGEVLCLMPQTVFETTANSDDLLFTGLVADRTFLGKAGLHANGVEAFEFFASHHGVQLYLPEAERNTIEALLLAMDHHALVNDNSLSQQEIARHTFLALMHTLAAVHRKLDTKPRLGRKDELAQRFFTMLSAEFRSHRNVQHYADALFVTAKHLSEAVKEVTGKTAGTQIDEAVIQEAKVLLASPGITVAQIADLLHFSDQSFFGKYFKKHTGCSPSDFRVRYWAA